MIKANELRIGNWVFGIDPASSRDKKYFRVDSIDEDEGINVYRVSGFENEPASEVEPIRLTPKVLVECGFEEIDGGGLQNWGV